MFSFLVIEPKCKFGNEKNCWILSLVSLSYYLGCAIDIVALRVFGLEAYGTSNMWRVRGVTYIAAYWFLAASNASDFPLPSLIYVLQILSFFMAEGVQAGAATVTAVRDAWTQVQQLKKMLDDSRDMDSIHYHMDRAMKMLHALMEDHQEKVQRHVTKMSSRTHIEWVCSVVEINNQVQELAQRYICESNRQVVIHAYSRSGLSEEMRKKGLHILDLWEKGNQFGDSLLVDKEVERVVKIVGAPEIQGFPTLQKPLQNILDLLANNKVKGIEVYGFVGYGKTAIMQNLNNHEKVKEMFDKVIWVKVSTEDKKKNSNIEHLQKVIIQRLKLVMDGVDDVGEVAKIIRKELESIKYLILLDDVKEDLDLNQVGIPHPKVGSKIVLATTIPNKLLFCRSLVDRRIEVKKLSDEEAWKMFQTILDRPDLMQNLQIKRVMHKVVKLGDGVPLMIKMVARCFIMRKTEEDWIDRFNNLRYWPRKGDDAMQELYDVLNFCYGNLNDAQKDCFLFSALYPEDGEIYCGGLLDGWWGENLLGGGSDDAIDVHAKARGTLQHLKTMLFLKEGMNNQYVRMDKWIRRAALYTMETADNPNHLIRTSEALKEPPKEQHWRQKKWISLVDNHLRTLPDKPDCSVLSTLFLQENSNLKKIPDPFFECMKNLRVLGLYGTGIVSLPSSLSNLISLRVLDLNGCVELVEFPSQIVELQNLEVLDIRGSGLNNIPPQIQSSIRLRRLLASFTCSINARNTQDGVIPQISTLKELIFDSKNRWNGMLNDVLKNLTTLRKLTNLQFCFQDENIDVIKKMADDTFKISAPKADHLNSFVETRDELEYTSFQLFVGCSITADLQIQEISEYQMYVKYCDGEGSNGSIVELLPKADVLEIVNHVDLEHLSDFGTQKLSRIRGCRIQSCPRIKTIVNGNCTLHTSILSNLERLYLDDLPELLSIWDGALQLQSLPKLITLYMAKCPKLIEIFPQEAVEEVIQTSHGLKSCLFPKMKEIMVIDMPNLTSVYENDSLEWPSLETVRISNCPKLTSLRFSKEKAKKLTTVDIK